MIVSTCMIQWLFFVIVVAVAFVAVDDVDGVAVALYRAFVSLNDVVVVDNLSAVAVVILNVVVALILTMFAVVIL